MQLKHAGSHLCPDALHKPLHLPSSMGLPKGCGSTISPAMLNSHPKQVVAQRHQPALGRADAEELPELVCYRQHRKAAPATARCPRAVFQRPTKHSEDAPMLQQQPSRFRRRFLPPSRLLQTSSGSSARERYRPSWGEQSAAPTTRLASRCLKAGEMGWLHAEERAAKFTRQL